MINCRIPFNAWGRLQDTCNADLQYVSMQYRSAHEVLMKVMVVREVINATMKLIEEVNGSAAPVKLAKRHTSNPRKGICSRIGNGAKTTMEYIDGFKYGSGNTCNVPGQQNYIRFQLSLSHDVDFDNFLDKINAHLPELHWHNKLFKAFSNCKKYIFAGVLMCSHWKHIHTDDLEVIFSWGSAIQLGLFSRNLEPWKPAGKKLVEEKRPIQAVHVE